MHILFSFQSSAKVTKYLVKNRPKVSKKLRKTRFSDGLWGGDIPNALDIIEISCKYKWDAEYGRDEYGIYPHEINEQYWIDNMNEIFSEIKRTFKL